MSEWTCNIGLRGRLFRGALGLLTLGAGIYLLLAVDAAFWGSGLCAFGGFAVFEAIVGWCAIRAMGIRLPF